MVRRAKLFYIRDRVGKATKIKGDVKRQVLLDTAAKAAAVEVAKAAAAIANKETNTTGESKRRPSARPRPTPPAARSNIVPRTPPGRDFKRWPFWKRWLGQRSERAAAAVPHRRAGHRIVAANVADPLGELDLITLDGATPRGHRRSPIDLDADPAVAAATVNPAKQKRVSEAAVRYLGRRRLFGV